MATKSRLITANLNLDQATNVAAGGITQLVWSPVSNGAGVNTTYEVPADFVLVVLSVFSTLLNGCLLFEFADDERTIRIPATTATPVLPPLVFESGKRVTVGIRNLNTAVGGSTTAYSVNAVLVPSVDYESEKWPESLPPFSPRPL